MKIVLSTYCRTYVIKLSWVWVITYFGLKYSRISITFTRGRISFFIMPRILFSNRYTTTCALLSKHRNIKRHNNTMRVQSCDSNAKPVCRNSSLYLCILASSLVYRRLTLIFEILWDGVVFHFQKRKIFRAHSKKPKYRI